MTGKEKIEKYTAEHFIKQYNLKYKTSFTVNKLSDNPDILCSDNAGRKLNLEITLTEDNYGDIKALLGRSEHKSIAYMNDIGSALSGNVYEQVFESINKKMLKDYGSNTALVVRDTSPIGWDWNLEVVKLRSKLIDMKNPFDKGVWILTTLPNIKIYKIL